MDSLIFTRPLVGALMAFLAVILIGPYCIRYLHKLKFGQNVRADGPKEHLRKSGTPTMGGIMIIIGLAFAILVLDHHRPDIIFALFVTLAYGMIGFLDDLLKILSHSSLGLKARQKLFGQVFVAILVALYALSRADVGTTLLVPFTDITVNLPIYVFIPLVIFVMLGVTNAVNLTDGLDGLAAGTVAVAACTYMIIAFKLGNPEIALFAAALAGACLGFAWFNAHPAAVFMGDTGSLALGAALGVMAILTRTSLFLPIVGGIFVIETLSVIIQVLYFRITHGKRIFRMAPLHHHFELKGWAETKVMIRFCLLGIFFGAIGLLAVL